MTTASDVSSLTQCSSELAKPLDEILPLLLRMLPILALRPRKAAKALDVSPRLLWEMTKRGEVPCVKVGAGKRKTVLYPVSDLQAWLSKQAAAAKGGHDDPR
jgi:hypothetical protein